MPYADPEKKKEFMRGWYARNQEYMKTYRVKTKSRRTEMHRAWRLRNLDARRLAMQKWREKPENRVASNLRSRISNVLRGRTKFLKFKESVGCSVEELRSWLEGWFETGMSWENYGQWEIDHARPCRSFDLAQPAEQQRCFHYLNLRPLWKSENRKKGDRYVL